MITVSVIKADVGSIGGHLTPSRRLIETVRHFLRERGEDLLIDSYVGHTGDDIAILMTRSATPSSRSGRGRRGSKPWRSRRRACTTSRGRTRGRTTP